MPCQLVVRGVNTNTSITHVRHAVDRVPNVLPGGDQDAGAHQDHHGGLVVEPEHIVVNAYRVKFEKASKLAEYVQHPGRSKQNYLVEAI